MVIRFWDYVTPPHGEILMTAKVQPDAAPYARHEGSCRLPGQVRLKHSEGFIDDANSTIRVDIRGTMVDEARPGSSMALSYG